MVKETSDPDRGRDKEISTFLFIIIIIIIMIKHTAFLYTDAFDFLLKGKKCLFHSSDLPNLSSTEANGCFGQES